MQLDPDFVADFTQGELREDMIHGQAAAQPKSNQDARDTSTPHSGTFAVHPESSGCVCMRLSNLDLKIVCRSLRQPFNTARES